MFTLALKIAGIGIGLYGGVWLTKLGVAWIKEAGREVFPPSYKKKKED